MVVLDVLPLASYGLMFAQPWSPFIEDSPQFAAELQRALGHASVEEEQRFNSGFFKVNFSRINHVQLVIWRLVQIGSIIWL
ncbi:hypothetical protein AMECASPLE_012049 [Ameca splendens]|uniref:Uncharacterized protein n=1 Tax=Ameca splendens TaxID=208324 RepID=A0ABV1A8V7_9TELE